MKEPVFLRILFERPMISHGIDGLGKGYSHLLTLAKRDESEILEDASGAQVGGFAESLNPVL